MCAASSDTNNTHDAFQSDLDLLEKELTASNDKQVLLRKFSIGLSMAILFLFIIYIGAFAMHINKNFSKESFQKHIQAKMGDVTDLATDLSLEVVKKVTPVYIKEIDKKSRTFVPQLLVDFEHQSTIFFDNMSRFADTEVEKRFHSILASQEKAFKSIYPDLTDKELKKILKETEADLDEMMTLTAKEIVDKFAPQIGDMKAIAERLTDSKKIPDEDYELIRLFLHNLLLLMDKEIMEG